MQESYIRIASPGMIFESKNAEVSLDLNHQFEFLNGLATLCIIDDHQQILKIKHMMDVKFENECMQINSTNELEY